jgi:hypothetical protein
MISIRRPIGSAVFAVLLLSCNEPQKDAEPAQSPDTTRPATSPPVLAPDTTVSAWTAGITSVGHDVSEIATLSAVRMAKHEGFDRFVVEFKGPQLPSYHVEYVDRPVRQCGSGDVVPVAGDAWLAIRLQPAQAHDEQGRATIEERKASPRFPILLEAHIVCDFEGQVEWVLGVSSPLGYRVSELTRPARLSIDLRRRRQ